MTAPHLAEDEFTELVDADIPRVDLVDKAANGMRFLLAKQADGATGLMDPEVIRDLLAKSEPESANQETVTMSGSPAAIAKLIHQAAQRAVEPVGKAEMSAADQNDLPDSDFAYVEDGGTKDESGKTTPRSLRHFPINDAAHVRNALARAPQSPFGDKAMPKIRAAAEKFGVEVAKAAEAEPVVDEGVDGLDPTAPLAAPEQEAPGDPAQPGSPAWEAIDAATARKWTSILARAKNALGVLADRELMEAACGADPDDVDSAWDLRNAQCAIDCAIDCLAGFAVDEQAEVDLVNDAQAVAKALDGFDPTALDTLEVLAPVRKAGRTLSAANELAIRQAVESLTKVLASLPQPQPDEADQPVAKKEETMLVDPTTTEETTDAAAVEKAAGEPTPLVPVYDATGKLVGVVDPGNLTPVACSENSDGGDGDEDMPDDTVDADGQAAVADEVAAAEQEMADMEPAPPASVGTPADAVHDDDVTKTTEPNETDTTTSDAEPQSSIADLVKAELDAHSAAQEEVIAKQAATLTEMAKTIETLNARIHTLEEQPAEPKVFTNGAVPPNIALRGQDRGAATQIDVAKAREMKQQLYRADAPEQQRIATDMQTAAIVALRDIHERRAPQ